MEEKARLVGIEYDHLLRYSQIDPEKLDGIVELLVETVCTARKTIRVAGDDYPAELVKAKLLKLNSGHIEFVMDCMRQNTTKIHSKAGVFWMFICSAQTVCAA